MASAPGDNAPQRDTETKRERAQLLPVLLAAQSLMMGRDSRVLGWQADKERMVMPAQA